MHCMGDEMNGPTAMDEQNGRADRPRRREKGERLKICASNGDRLKEGGAGLAR